MMKKLYILLTIIFITTTIQSQSCLPEGIEFTSQEQIDNFQTNYPDCSKIIGNVRIEDGITNLNGLNSIQVIGGYLRIADTDNLQNLDGLESLDSIGTILNEYGYFGSLYIGYAERVWNTYPNDSLSNIDGLSGLSYVGGSVWIMYNPLLENLDGLESLTSIGGHLGIEAGFWGSSILESVEGLSNLTSINGGVYLHDLDSLTSLQGLQNITSIEGSLEITSNDNLTDLNGFNNLTSIGGGISISGNNNLTDLYGLNNITSIGGDIWIIENLNLTNLNGFENLISIGGSLYIGDSDSLIDLNGLNSLSSIGDGLYIEGNISLSECEVQSICAYLENPNAIVSIHDNATGCNSVEEVEDACNLVGINENVLFNNVSIFPNPNTGLVNIDLGTLTDVAIKILNVNGRLIYYKEHINSPIYQFELEASPGIYILELSAEGEKQQFKLIKQ